MDEYDDADCGAGRGPEFPLLVRIAGAIWILFGTLGIIGALFQFATAGAAKAPGGGGPAPSAPCCGLLIAIAFLHVGYQTVTGKAKDTLGNSIGSIGLGLVYYALIVVLVFVLPPGPGGNPGMPEVIVISLLAGLGTMLVLAGGLALVDRAQYKAWRQAAGYGRPARRKDRAPEDE